MAQPRSNSTALLFTGLILRLVSLAAVVITIGILSSNNITIVIDSQTQVKGIFRDVYAYRYMLSTAVIGAAYTIFQIAFTVSRMNMSNSSNSDTSAYIDFFGDKIASYILATGAAAGFGVTKDLKRAIGLSGSEVDKFFDKGYAIRRSRLLLGFICLALLSIASSFNLPKKAQ